jgi:hypothetical protein
MAATENYDEVFAPFPYESVTKGVKVIRRYRGTVYTEWRDGRFLNFVYAIDGAALFEERKDTVTEGGGDGVVPFYVYAVGAQRDRDTLDGWEKDPDGLRIVCYVDKYRNIERYEMKNKDGDVLEYIEKNKLRKTLLESDWIITMDYEIKRERQKIDDMYRPHMIRMFNVECRYLHQQLQHIQSQRENGTKCALDNKKLEALETTLKKRYEELGRTTGLTNSINTMWSARTDMITKRLTEMRKLVEEI